MSSNIIRYFTLFFFFCNSSIILSQEVTSYYLLRHAEKELRNPENKNPHLTKQGEIRALNWKNIFKHISFDNIYSTNYFRTQETARPTAEDKGIIVEKYDPKNLYNELFKEKNKGKKILVVGHSNTTPALANLIIGKNIYTSIDESIHGNLYIINIINNNVTYELLNLE
ncbi:MAG: SixA phosphatase family protein [Flavobacteriaceae bacterium]